MRRLNQSLLFLALFFISKESFALCLWRCPTPTPTPKPSPTPSPVPSPSPSPTVKTHTVPASSHEFLECRSGSGFSVADCINQIAAKKVSYPSENWLIKISSGTYSMKESVVLFGVQNLTIEGGSLTSPSSTSLIANGLPSNRNTLQYFSWIIADVKNVTLQGFKLDGNNLSGTRGVAICSSYGKTTSGLKLDKIQMRNYVYFNVIGGNSIATENLSSIVNAYASASVPTSKLPIKKYAQYLASFPLSQLYCGGAVHDLTVSSSTLYMKSVGFYFVPPTQQATYAAQVSSPDVSGSSVPSWYGQARNYASQFYNIVVTKNQFLNDQLDSTKVAAADYHSAMKLGASMGMKITQNTIDAESLPNAFASGAALNLGSDSYDALIDGNTIKLPSTSPYRNGLGVPMYYEQHSMYGFGNVMIFGQLSGTRVTNNAFINAGIRLQDCCVKASATAFDARPFCEQQDALLTRGLNNENIFVGYNSKNGALNRDLQLLFRQSSDTAWVQSYKNLEASGSGGIYCRQKFGVTYATDNGSILIPK